MNDINNAVFEYVEKNPEKVVQQFHAYLDSQKDNEEHFSNNEDFQQYNLEKSEESEDLGEYKFEQNKGRVSKYAM